MSTSKHSLLGIPPALRSSGATFRGSHRRGRLLALCAAHLGYFIRLPLHIAYARWKQEIESSWNKKLPFQGDSTPRPPKALLCESPKRPSSQTGPAWGQNGALLLLFLFFLLSCQSTPTPYNVPTPPDFVAMIIPSDNPTTEEGVGLGKQLFFDPILSEDISVSCATCHRPELAFTDGGAVSKGIGERLGRRSAPSLLNIGFHYKGIFWDGRSPSLEDQALHPLADSLEMGTNWPLVESRLQAHATYPTQFQAAFGSSSRISKANIAKALAQYQRTLISSDSKYDRVRHKKATFTAAEKRGWMIFFDAGYPEAPMAECSHCHSDPLFTNLDFANNGLDSSQTLLDFPDLGLGGQNGNKYDNGKFRVPTLRNISLTAPYMHDGRFLTLEAVIAHYNQGGHYAENVDPNVRPLHLSPQDQADLLAFLNTLTDDQIPLQ